MFSRYELRVIMFAPTASPVVQRQSTWHIGPTTWVRTSRSFAQREREGSSCDSSHSRSVGSSASTQRASSTASPVDLQMKQLARVIRSASTYVRKPPDSVTARAPRYSEAERPPSVCASGTYTVSDSRPRSSTTPSGSRSA